MAAWGTGATPLAEDVQMALAQQAAQKQRPRQQRRHSGTVRAVAAAAAAAAAAGSDDDDADGGNDGCGRVVEASITSAVINCDLLAAVRALQAERQRRQPQQHPQPAPLAAATTSFPSSLPPDTAVSALDVIREVGFVAPCLRELRVLGRCATTTPATSSFSPPPTAATTDAAGDVLGPPPPPPPSAVERRGTVLSVPSLRDLDLCSAARRTLRVLSCAGVGLRRLEGLSALPLLEELYLPFNAVEDASPAACLGHLVVLDLEGNQVPSLASVQTLRECERLRHLTLAGCPVASAEGYRGDVAHLLPRLATLDELPGEALTLAALATSERQVLSRGTHPEPRACDVAPLLAFVDGGGGREGEGRGACDGDALSGLLEALSPTVDAALMYARLRDGGGGGGGGGDGDGSGDGCVSAASALMHARGSRGLFCGGTLLRRASAAVVLPEEEEEVVVVTAAAAAAGSVAAAVVGGGSSRRVRGGAAGDVAFRKTRAGLRRRPLRTADEVAAPEKVGKAAVAAAVPTLDVIDVVDAY